MIEDEPIRYRRKRKYERRNQNLAYEVNVFLEISDEETISHLNQKELDGERDEASNVTDMQRKLKP